MKKTLRFLSYFIMAAILCVIWTFHDITLLADASFLLPYLLCALFCPFLGILPLLKSLRGVLSGVTAVSFCFGIPLGMALDSFIVSYLFLFLGALSLGTRMISHSLPAATSAEALLALRGVPKNRVRRVSLLRISFAFFFEKSGILTGFLCVLYLCIRQNLSLSSLWSVSFLTLLVSFLGFVLYLLLGAPEAAPLLPQPKKRGVVLPAIFSFLLLLVFFYVYIGYIYTSPEPALENAIRIVQTILTPALVSAALAFPAGMFLGFLLSLCGARFFKAVCQGFLLLPPPLTSSLFFLFVKAEFPALFLPLVLWSAHRMLQSRLAVRPYRKTPMPGRKKAISWPLFHLANLSLLPRLFAWSIFSAFFLHCLSSGSLFSLSEITMAFAGCILASILFLLYLLSFVTKEACRYE